MLIVSWRTGLCGKLISSKTCLLESDWWSLEVLLMCLLSVCICVHVQWGCTLQSPSDGLIWLPLCHQQGFRSESGCWHQLPHGWSGTICSRRVLCTPQQRPMWDGLNGTYVALMISTFERSSGIADHRSEHSKVHKALKHSWNRWLQARSHAVCLKRHHSGKNCTIGRKQLTLFVY